MGKTNISFRKVLIMVLAVLVIAALMVGCGVNEAGSGGNTETGSGGNTETGSGGNTETGSGGVEVITIGIPKNANVADYENNALTKWLEETTGYDIQIVEYEGDSKDYLAKLSGQVVTDQKLPDILYYFQFSDDLRNDYGEHGVFIDLKPYFNDKEKSKGFWDSYETLSDYDQQWFLYKVENERTGAWYALPCISPSKWDTMNYQPWINQEWLDNLGLPVPQDTDDLVATLRAFRTMDPNKNGDPNDEIPCIGSTSTMGGNVVSWLVNMKMYCDSNNWVNVRSDGTVYAPAVTEEYRQALIWVSQLMDEGLVSEAAVSTKAKDLKSYIASDANRYGVVVCHPTAIIPTAEGMERWTPVPIWGNAYYNETPSKYCNFITEYCENPDAAWEVLMALSSKEGTIRQRYGEQGVDWDWADEGGLALAGTPAVIKVYNDVFTETHTSQCWRVAACGIFVTTEMESVQVTGQESELELAMNRKIKSMIDSYAAAVERSNATADACPRLWWESEDKADAERRTDVTGLFQSETSKFVVNADNKCNPANQAHWNAYISELNDATYGTWINVVQRIAARMIQDGLITLK